jgi:hypothetical protein
MVNATGTTTITITEDTFFQGAVITNLSSITLRGDAPERTILSPDENTYAIKVERGVTLTLENIILNGICVEVNAGGTLVMNNASTITGSSVYGVSVSGTFTMNGGRITNNTWSGVSVDSSGIFTMNGGTIATNDKGISIGGTVTMNNGRIENNGDGGVTVYGQFYMRGGTIADNRAYRGGGVNVYEAGQFYMSGGTIAGNRASVYGGGVYVASKGVFRKTGGTIYGSNGGSNANRVTRTPDLFEMTMSHAIYDNNRFIMAIDRTLNSSDNVN